MIKLAFPGKFDPSDPVLLSLAGGGLGGALLGGLTSNAVQGDEKDPSERRKRVLRDALLGAAVGAGAGGLGAYGFKQLATAKPVGEPTPLESTLTDPWLLGGLGGAGLTAGAFRNAGMAGKTQKALSDALGDANPSAESFKNWTRDPSNINNVRSRLMVSQPDKFPNAWAVDSRLRDANVPVGTNRLRSWLMQILQGSKAPKIVKSVGGAAVRGSTGPLAALERIGHHAKSPRALALGGLGVGLPLLLNYAAGNPQES
jgi:hypothetical protein